ncbi:MAG: prefoldin subunit beta [Candidatus Nanoarchaeia archaeon]|nr:prefoldin subunit beta [Candidatus Nanoarchaeia archaeon]MDD5239798.1 prefoldin subunit beta [Candidatus Nanoarchaeia archaeon]
MNDKADNEDIMQFQQTQQQLQMLLMQKQNMQIQGSEIVASITELGAMKEDHAFEVVGNILVKKSKDELNKRLKEKEELLNLRVSSIDKQVEKLTDKAKKLQEKLAKSIK